MSRCPTCFAILEDENQMVILACGNQTKIKHWNRVCTYAVEREKPCINNIRITDKSLSWDAAYERLEKDFNYLIQEM